jgi:hypothetical protein
MPGLSRHPGACVGDRLDFAQHLGDWDAKNWDAKPPIKIAREERMTWPWAASVVGGVLIAAVSSAMAHHSFAMFDQDNPIELEGVVQEFKYTSPHSYIILQVKAPDGGTVIWNLEGRAPSLLTRDGWSSRTLKAGDELRLMVDPLRSGAPGGAWSTEKIRYRDGNPIVVTH